MKKLLSIITAITIALCCSSCGEEITVTTNMPENYYVDYLFYEQDGSSTNMRIAKIDGEFFCWNDADVTMHYYHKNGDKYEEYSYNASTEDGYPTKPVATYDNIDNIIAEKVALMYDTKNFKTDGSEPETATFNGFSCKKYINGEDYMYVLDDYNIVAEYSKTLNKTGDKMVYGFFTGNGLYPNPEGFFFDIIVPEQFRDQVKIVECPDELKLENQ